MFNAELLADAEDELAEAFDWYEEQQEGLGIRFYREIDYYINLMESNPYLFSVKYTNELRAASLNKFPYLIIFWVDETQFKLFIVSIFHTSRKPKYLG